MNTPRSLRLTFVLSVLVAFVGALDVTLTGYWIRGGPTMISGLGMALAVWLSTKQSA